MKQFSSIYILFVLLLFINIKSKAQPCNPYPGYTTWLGYTDVWEDSTNWCPAIAPVNTSPAMNVRIPGGPSGPYTYYRPVIRPGVYAWTEKLRVESNDTIFIQGINQCSLTVNDSLKIQDATSAIIFDSISRCPIYVRGHWENNGTFEPGRSRVTFQGPIYDQQIGGQSKTTFYNLEISNSNHVMRLQDFTVKDSLFLLTGRLKLNLGMMTLLNPNPAAITWTTGRIQAETDQLIDNLHPFGRLYWKMGSIPGVRVIPFVNPAGFQVYMDYSIVSGTHDVVLGTYGTFPNNTNLPLPEVTNVFGLNGGSYNSSGDNVVDRFYLIKDSLGINPVAQVTFRYTNAERGLGGMNGMCAQQWINSLDAWANPLLTGQVLTLGSPSDLLYLIIPDSVFSTSEWWSINSCYQPLSIDLQDNSPDFILAYPNPVLAGDMLNLMLDGNSFHPDLIRIYSADGREVIHEKFQPGKSSIQIPESFSPGIYTVEFNSRKKSGMIRLVILEQ